jgi:tetratricopeptide (TPR) repeat protein
MKAKPGGNPSLRPASAPLAAALVVAGLALITFAPALGNGFVWDDKLILAKQLSAFPTVADVFFPPANIPQYSRFYYRPLVVLTYLVDDALGGGAALPFHVTPLLVHVLVCVLLFFLLHRLLGATAVPAAAAGALAFAVHPAHAEVVAWMAGRGDALATCGVVAALLCWGRWLESPSWLWLAAGAGSLLFGLLGKEAAIAGAPLAAALPWVWPRRARGAGGRTLFLLWAAIAASVAAYLVLRGAGPGFAPGVTRAAAPSAPDVLGTIGFYAAAVLWPATAGVVRTAPPSEARLVVLGLLAFGAWSLALLWAAQRRARLAAWALAWVGIALAPALLLVVRAVSETPVAERYLYLPSAGLALLVALGLARLPQRLARRAAAAAAVPLALWTVLGAVHATIWRDDLRFWSNAAAAAPDDGFVRTKLGSALYDRGDIGAAEAAFRHALGVRLSGAQRAVTQNNLGWLLLKQQRRAEAEPLLRAAVAAQPAFSGPYRGLAECLWPRGEDPAVRAEIKALLARAIHLDPGEAGVAFLLASAHLAEGDRAAAARWFEHAIRADPRGPAAAQARAMLATLRGG